MRRPVLTLVAAAALAVPLVGGSPAAAAPQPTDLLTGFEERAGVGEGEAAWTTLQEEADLLADLEAASDRVDVTTVAQSVQGRPVRLVQIAGRPGTPAQVSRRSSVLISCLQHGNEPAAREGCLQGIRDLVLDTSPATRRLLDRTTVLVMPTVNPDGRAANTRANADGVDVNRDHLVLATPEARAIAEVVRDYGPDVLYDAHEFGGRRDVYDREFIRLWPRNLNVDERVRASSVALSRQYIDPTLQDAGYTTGDYGIWYGADGRPIAQVAGDEDERILRNMAGLRHLTGQLTESLVNAFDPQEAADPALNRLRRVDTQVLGFQAVLDLARERGPELRRQSAQAALRAAQEGAAGDQPFFFAGADNDLPGPDDLDLTPPCAYTLPAAAYQEVARTLDLHGVRTTTTDGVVTVSMAQAAQPVIPLLLDERAGYNLVDATPVECATAVDDAA